jgi:hypothetical protein
MHSFHQSVVTYLSIIGRLVRVMRGLGVPEFFVAGCHDGLLWPVTTWNDHTATTADHHDTQPQTIQEPPAPS